MHRFAPDKNDSWQSGFPALGAEGRTKCKGSDSLRRDAINEPHAAMPPQGFSGVRLLPPLLPVRSQSRKLDRRG
jgi:hypothetical protein